MNAMSQSECQFSHERLRTGDGAGERRIWNTAHVSFKSLELVVCLSVTGARARSLSLCTARSLPRSLALALARASVGPRALARAAVGHALIAPTPQRPHLQG